MWKRLKKLWPGEGLEQASQARDGPPRRAARGDWMKAVADDGRTYYYNAAGDTRWDLPDEPRAVSVYDDDWDSEEDPGGAPGEHPQESASVPWQSPELNTAAIARAAAAEKLDAGMITADEYRHIVSVMESVAAAAADDENSGGDGDHGSGVYIRGNQLLRERASSVPAKKGSFITDAMFSKMLDDDKTTASTLEELSAPGSDGAMPSKPETHTGPEDSEG